MYQRQAEDQGVFDPWKSFKSLLGGAIGLQQLLGESVDLVRSSNLVRQQRQLYYVEIFI